MSFDTLLFIPTYNDNSYFYDLIPQIRRFYSEKILCIDDGSTVKIIDKFNDPNLKIIHNSKNYGKGYCIIEASKYAIKNGYKYLLVLDSDMQHDPSKINDFLLKRNKYIFIYGKRNFLKNMPFFRILSNFVTSLIISLKCKKRIYDSQCGYRLYSLSLFKNAVFSNNGYQFESEILLKSINRKSSISFVKIPTIYNDNESNIKSIRDTFKFIKLILLN